MNDRVVIKSERRSAKVIPRGVVIGVSEEAPKGLGFHYGVLAKLACKCAYKDDAYFLIKKDRIICSACGQEIACKPPIVTVVRASCKCCLSNSTTSTFILDSKGIYICTWCGSCR